MLTRQETQIFAWLVKKLGGEVKIPLFELEDLNGWEVQYHTDPSGTHLTYKLIRHGVTIDGEYSSPSPSREHLPPSSSRSEVPTPVQVRRPAIHFDVPSASDPVSERPSESLWDAAPKRRFFGEEG